MSTEADHEEQPSIPHGPGQQIAAAVDYSDTATLPFPVVGIGASAGGIQAVCELLANTPDDTGMAFVVIQHLPPDHQSMLAEIFARQTKMPVSEIEDGMTLAPNRVYVIRPAFSISVDGGTFTLGEPVEERGHRRPVDDFFRSLARVQREKAIAVVLSGVGTNGTSGAQAIKAAGGVCIAQDPDTADFGGMPRSLINSGYADHVCKVQEIPELLIRYIHHPYLDPATRGREHAETLLRPDKEYLTQIFAILRTRTGHSFNGYKKPTVLRRIQRRMGLRGMTDLHAYTDCLREDTEEARALANDLMINVTGFFRDPEAWEGLRSSVIAPMIERCPPDGSIRAWVTACASGEEAYTLGMLLFEEMDRQSKHVEVKIFATDTADKALAFARAGVYPTGIEGDLDPDRLDHFFDKEEHTYRVKKALRDSVVFAAHDVLRDPPFSRVDLCTCRNLLIYLEPEVQQRVIFMLHFALREAGYLFLGSAETPGPGEKLFETISKKWRIYQRTNVAHHPFDLSGIVSLATLSHAGRRDLAVSLPMPASRTLPTLSIQQALLNQVSSATLVVDRTDRIVYFSGDTTPYVTQPSGEPTRDVFEMMKPSLRAAARTALRRAATKGEPVNVFAEINSDDSPHAVHLSAAPLPTSKPPEFFRLTFELAPITSLATTEHSETERPDDARLIASMLPAPEEAGLEDELRIMRRELQSTVEAFEASNEELKASHEEVVSINEELQSANEELETGKEELQSLNEELITVNAQLQAKIAELEATTNDLSNLLSSTNIAVVFLDTQFRVRRFTPAVYDLLELIPGDIGRPIANLAQKFVGGGLLEDARVVLARLIPLETEVLSNSGSWYLRRTLPYRTADNHIDGVVITFVDITARRRAEQEVASSQARLQSIIDQLPVATLMVDATNGTLLHANRPAAQLLRLPDPVPMIGSDWKLAAASFQGRHPDGRPFLPREWPLAQSLEQGISVAAREFRYPDGTPGVLSMSSTPVLNADGKMVVAVATLFDITEQRRAAEKLRESEQRLQLLIDSALDYAIFMLDLEGRIISWNRGAERLLGWTEEEAIGRSGTVIFTPEDRAVGVPEKELEAAKRDGRAVDERVHVRRSGERFWANGMLMGVYDDKGTLCRYAKIIRDETERKRAEEELQRALHEAERVRATAESANRAKDEFISTISHELRTPLNTIRLWARMLGSERLPEQDRIEGVRMIDRSAEAQQHLIDDLLDVSRMSSGQLRLNLRVTRLSDVIRSAIESVRPSADVRKIQIVADLSDEVGVVRADPERIQQVLLNLISNAVKFTPGGGRIDVDMTRSGNDVIIVVKDTGIGIRPEFLPYVFERFRQAEVVTTRQHGGLGLGLAIAKQLVELHGGSIVAASEGEGRGATFTATLPLPRSNNEQRNATPSQRSLSTGMNDLRILLVEDDAGSRLATCRALELRGAAMDAVANASLAMTAYSQTRPDAMILDIGLPAEDGYSLIARIREQETAQGLSRVPAIALTAFARPDDRERAFSAGFDEHLAKPVDIETLEATLLRLTRRDRS